MSGASDAPVWKTAGLVDQRFGTLKVFFGTSVIILNNSGNWFVFPFWVSVSTLENFLIFLWPYELHVEKNLTDH